MDSYPLHHQGSPWILVWCLFFCLERMLPAVKSLPLLPPSFFICAKSLQSCPTLGDSIDGSPPGSPLPGILQARTLEWVAISFSNAWKWKVKVKLLSHVRLFETPWTAAHQAPPSMGFSSVLAWKIPGTGEPGGLLSMGSHRVRHDWSDLAAAAASEHYS